MLLSLLCILLVTTALEAASHPKNSPTTLSNLKKVSNSQHLSKENQIINSSSSKDTKSEIAKANDVIIQNEHNLLGVTMSIVTALMEMKSLTLSNLSWEVISALFGAAMSVIFGPNANILWPQFANIAVPFLKLLTL